MQFLLYLTMFLQLPVFILDLIKLFYLAIVGLPIALLTQNKEIKTYVFNNLLSVDQSVNALTGGSKNETCSSRLGRYQNTVWFAMLICKFLDIFDKDHCKKYVLPELYQENEVIE